jgi:precorrin-3B synthase
MRRGACPSLDLPMPTGDGLLARLPPATLPPAAWLALAEAARRAGNGWLDLTARGSVQLRGLRAETLALAKALVPLEWPRGALVMTSPLAGEDAEEVEDPRPLANALTAATPAGLPPKTTVLVDGGGRLHLAPEAAHLRLVAQPGRWVLGCGAAWLGEGGAEAIVTAALALLRDMGRDATRAPSAAACRAAAASLAPTAPPAPLPAPEPIGLHALRDGVALGIGLPFGRVEAAALAEFATAPRDPRRRVAACTGAPGCASALLDTRALAVELAPLVPATGFLHVSGCAKGCAHPRPAPVTLVGREGGLGLIRRGRAGDTPHATLARGEARAALAREFR